MNDTRNRTNSGAALIMTLVLLSIIAMVSISYLAITTKHAEVSGSLVSGSRAELGEKAALADATQLLEALTVDDHYLVTLSTPRDPENGNLITRYSFISVPDESTITHYPLFAGGRVIEDSLPDFNDASTAALSDGPVAPPSVDLSETEPVSVIETAGLAHLNTDGQLEDENVIPKTGFIELSPNSGDTYLTRYTFWMEDLEGLPNLDTAGIWTDNFDSPLSGGHLDFVRLGYSQLDPRAGNHTDEPGLRLATLDSPDTYYQFPGIFRGQQLTGQMAPGLSPREITVMPWETPEISLQEHPFAEFARLASLRNTHATTPTPQGKSRFSSALNPYRSTQYIPFGHDYADEGEIRFPLNQFVADNDLSIAEIIERNLPRFEERRGGFPDEESYLNTIAGNAIDYADPDSLPSSIDNTTNAGTEPFRGVDSYSPVNEFFVKFEYKGYEDKGDHYLIIFIATPYAEFWNPFDQTATLADATLSFSFLEDIRFRANSEWHRIEDDDLKKDDASANPVSISIPPNGYKVHPFGELRWEVEVEADPDSPIAFPVVQDIRGVKRSSTRANYELKIGDQLVDSCGRQGEASDPDYGFFFARYSSTISPGKHFMRMTTPALSGRAYGVNSGFGSHLGDPWMPYLSRSTADGTTPPTYKTKATPGSRNFDHDKVESSRSDWYKDQARVRDWPDRGYDTATGPSPSSDEELPTSFTGTHEPGKAPWRISNRGRYFSVTELGHLHDPVMWIYGPSSGSNSVVQKQSNQHFDKFRDDWLRSIPEDAEPGAMWGGGNTLRIGRAEHAKFDQPGMRASQLLDLFHAGVNGTNLLSPDGSQNDDLYHFHDPRDHQPLPAGIDAVEAQEHPFNHHYESDLHAQSPFRLINGHLNINTAPTILEIETLLRGPFVSSWHRLETDSYETPTYTSADVTGALESGLKFAAIPEIARELYQARPFYSPSHLARVLSHLIENHDALPAHHNDAEAEETFARLFNTTTFKSRHFRIYTYAETYHHLTGEVVARRKKAYNVFVRPVHNPDGTIESSRLEVLSVSRL